jgi:hypothetical protein
MRGRRVFSRFQKMWGWKGGIFTFPENVGERFLGVYKVRTFHVAAVGNLSLQGNPEILQFDDPNDRSIS